MDVDLKTAQGSEAAGRRAWMTLVAARQYGDVDDIRVISVTTVCTWYAACENPADGTETHPFLGEVPCCERCRSIAQLNKSEPRSIAHNANARTGVYLGELRDV